MTSTDKRQASSKKRRGKKPPRTPDGQMSLREHLRELRNRFFKAAIAIVDRKSTRLNYSHVADSCVACCLIRHDAAVSCELMPLLTPPSHTSLHDALPISSN